MAVQSTFVFDLWSDNLKAHNLYQKFYPFSILKDHTKVCVLPITLSAKAIMSTSCVSNGVYF